MGIIIAELGSIDFGSVTWKLEYNKGAVVHIHIVASDENNIHFSQRIDLSIDEFRQFVKANIRARDELKKNKGIK